MKRIALRWIFMASILLSMFACVLRPADVQAASGPKLNKTKVTVYVGQKTTLKVKGASGKVVWDTKDKKVAAVSRPGKITGKKAGKTTIIAKVGKRSIKCKVTVKEPYLNAKSKTLDRNKRFQLKLTGAKIKRCTSSDKRIVSVTNTGRITAVKTGRAVISVKASNEKVYKCSVTVKGGNAPTQKPPGGDPPDEDPSNKDPSEKDPIPTDPPETDPPEDLSGLDLDIYITEGYTYTGEAIEPKIRLYSGVLYLQEGVDYALSYTDNVDAGNAQITISGIGRYTGKVTKGFEILKAHQYIQVDLPDKVYVGKTGKIQVSGAYGDLGFETSKDGIVQIDSDGTITGSKPGFVDIYMTVGGDKNHHGCDTWCYGSVQVMHEEASAYGFPGYAKSGGDRRYKSVTSSDADSDGSIVYVTRFDTNSDMGWLDDVTFEIEDATPAAYKKMFQEMGVDCSASGAAVQPIPDMIFENIDISAPVTADDMGSTGELACSSEQIEIRAGAGVRVVKVTAKRHGVFLDEVYLGYNGRKNGAYSAFDLDLYKRVRERIEAQIWTEQMSDLERLQTMARYINETAHYPGTEVTQKEYNPTYWEDWSVDGIKLFYDMFNDVILNRIMSLQGGMVTCLAAQILERVAEEDLGLPYLYTYDPDTDTEEIAAGEGVWTASGRYSSAPWNPGHISLIYKGADEKRVFIDAQGLILSGSMAACETHGCREKIISLTMPVSY